MLTKDFTEKLGVDETQVTELNTFIETAKLDETQQGQLLNSILSLNAELRKKYDGTANQNAERILDGAAKKVEEITGIKREQGVKIADYFTIAGTKHLESREQKLKEREKVLEEKIKNGNIDESVKKELAETKNKLDILLQKEASIDDIIKGDYKTKYEKLVNDNNILKLNNAFASIKPSFPAEVNQYEAAAKWKNFVSNVQEKYNIEINDDNEAIGIDKENQYKIVKLADLVKTDKEISELLQGRQQSGLNHKKAYLKLEGIPFNVPENATSEEIALAIKEYLLNVKKLSFYEPEYAKQFGALNIQILKGKQQKTA